MVTWQEKHFTPATEPVAGSVVPLVTSLLTVATAVLTAVGIGSGLTIRLLRNSPFWVVLFVVLLLASISLAASAKTRRPLILAGAVFLVALGGFTWLVGKVSRAAERPHLVATAETTTNGMVKVTATVKAEGLTTKELIYLVARGHSRVSIDPTTGSMLEAQGTNAGNATVLPPEVLVEEAALGPNASGAVDATFAFEVSPALYKDILVKVSRNQVHVRSQVHSGGLYEPECIPMAPAPANATTASADLTYSCVRLILPFGATRPSVVSSFGMPDEKGRRLLTVAVSAVGVPPSKIVVVDVLAGKTRLIHHTLAPDLVGKVQGAPTTPVDARFQQICILAALVNAGNDASMDEAAQQGYCTQARQLPLTVSLAHLGNAPPVASAAGTAGGRKGQQGN